ncbi:TRAP transporter small permease subunit [Nisaea sp.]|uniref:TRAP transporter small permease subunit n=1 Tax=Nisaea sp. TaxID=2024842 RepID=UPI002B2740BF|nr:TRAP transporter small permease subunit [Nisaea sp.]
MNLSKRAIESVSEGVNRITVLSNAFGSLFVLFLVAAVIVDVVARGVFHAPLKGSVELVEFSVVFIVFLQLPDVVRVGRLTRSDGLLRALDNRAPRISTWIRRALDSIGAVLMALIAITMYPEVLEAWETGHYVGTPGVFTAPAWPIKLAIFFGAAMCCMRWTLNVVQSRTGAES